MDIVWYSIRNDLEDIFAKVNEDFHIIKHSFRTITLTMDPTISWQIDSKNGQLTYNLWSLLFSITTDNRLMFVLPYKTASSILHEYTHLQSIYKLGLLGNRNETTTQQQIQMELDALACEIDFLQKCIKLIADQKRYLKILSH